MTRNRWLLISLCVAGVVVLVFMVSPLLYGGCPAGRTGPCCAREKVDPAAACSADCTKACCAAKATPAPAEKVEAAEIDTPALKALVRAKVAMTLLDARGVQQTRIPGAVAMSVQTKDDVIATTAPDKDTLLVTYCGGLQCPLSTMLAKRLHALGYRNVLEYRPGIRGWTASGGEVETAKKETAKK